MNELREAVIRLRMLVADLETANVMQTEDGRREALMLLANKVEAAATRFGAMLQEGRK